MAQAYKCDRCNVLFERDITPNITVQKYIHGYGTNTFDLCPECQCRLEKWLNIMENFNEK